MEQRNIQRDWISTVVNEWVARKYNSKNNSMNYYGFIAGQENLLMVALSEANLTIPTVFFDSGATDSYAQGDLGYFDEVR